MCSGIDAAPLLSGFVVITIKNLLRNNKTRHHDFKENLMHQLRLEMDMGLFRVLEGFEVSRSITPFNGKAKFAPLKVVMVQCI